MGYERVAASGLFGAAFGNSRADAQSAERARRVERDPDDFRLCACHKKAHNECVADTVDDMGEPPVPVAASTPAVPVDFDCGWCFEPTLWSERRIEDGQVLHQACWETRQGMFDVAGVVQEMVKPDEVVPECADKKCWTRIGQYYHLDGEGRAWHRYCLPQGVAAERHARW